MNLAPVSTQKIDTIYLCLRQQIPREQEGINLKKRLSLSEINKICLVLCLALIHLFLFIYSLFKFNFIHYHFINLIT